MPTPADDKVQLLVGGKMHQDFETYEVDSDFLTPADAWHVSLGVKADQNVPAEVAKGAAVEVRVGGERVMVGRIDEKNEPVGHGDHSLQLSGRDGAAILVDCSAPIFSARQCSLADVVAKIVRPLGITKIRIDAAKTARREKINVEPGDTAWEALSHAAEANGLWPWFDPDGTLVVGGPDYTTPPVCTLVLRRNGQGNNVERFTPMESIHDEFSQVTVLGQTHGTETETGKNAIRATAKDPNASWYRPKIVVDHETDNTALALDRARKLLADSKLAAFTLTAEVKGHRIIAPGMPGDGKLWSPGMRVNVLDEVHGIKGVFFLMGRKMAGGRGQPTKTILTFKKDGVWVRDAHPHKRRHRRGKNGIMEDYLGPAS